MLDPKPIGAFIEYTLKPLIDDTCDLLNKLESHNIKLRDVLGSAWRLYLIDSILRLIATVACTGLICLTIYFCLHIAR